MSRDKSIAVSGPFNVQHIPKMRNITQSASDTTITDSLPSFDPIRSNSVTSTANSHYSTTSSTSSSTTTFSSNSIVVCIHQFHAEYDNEVSCTPGDVFKLVDPRVTNGWVLAQSLSSGYKGWVPKDCVKILDLFNHNNGSNASNAGGSSSNSIMTSSTSPLNSINSPLSLQSNTFSNNYSLLNQKDRSKNHKKNSLDSTSKPESLNSSNSVLDYYSTPMTPSSTLSAIDNNNREVNPLLQIYSSIFAHSMYILESAPSSYWYRLDLVFSQNINQQSHLCRYYTDLLTLHKFLDSQAKAFKINIELPKLPPPFQFSASTKDINSEMEISFVTHLSEIDYYLKNLFDLIALQPKTSPLIPTFIRFCQPMDNDFEHYVPLDDDQILNILKPGSESSNNDIELIFEDGDTTLTEINVSNANISTISSSTTPHKNHTNSTETITNNQFDDFIFKQPKLKSSNSMSSLNSKLSTASTSSSAQNSIKVKIIYKGEFSLIKIPNDALSFNNLSIAISEKLEGLQRFTLAYKNDNGIFILLRDDVGLNKALLVNNKKIIIKVI